MDSNENKEVPDDLVFFSFDLNNLKETNDNYGHEVGDELIVGAAKCMKNVLGSYGSIYRTGGDEFAAIINVSEKERAALIGKMRDKFSEWKSNASSGLSISMGYVCSKEIPGMSLQDMRREAEKRMYAQKSDYYMKEGNDRRRGRAGHI